MWHFVRSVEGVIACNSNSMSILIRKVLNFEPYGGVRIYFNHKHLCHNKPTQRRYAAKKHSVFTYTMYRGTNDETISHVAKDSERSCMLWALSYQTCSLL